MRPHLLFRGPHGVRASDAILLLLRAVLLAFLVTGIIATRSATAQEELETLTIVTSSGTYPFSVEVMRTVSQRERGLMFRKHLPSDRGMLFDFETEQSIMMWMKNTYLPLDMIFISRSGKVVRIARNAEPLSESIIPSGFPAAAVLEVNAGTAAKIGLGLGDRIRHPLFGD